MRKLVTLLLVMVSAQIALAQTSREWFWRCHMVQQQLFLSADAATGSTWSCADGSATCTLVGGGGNLITGSEISVGDFVSMSDGTHWLTFEVETVATDDTFTRSSTICNDEVLDSSANDVLPAITSSALYNISAGLGATSLQLYDGQGNAAAFGLSTTEAWATELRVGGSSGAVCLADDSGQLDITDCSAGLADVEAGAITATSLSLTGGGSFLEVDDTLDAASGNEVASDLSYTVNKAAGNDTGLRISKTDTASPGASYLLEGYTGSTQHFGFSDDGNVSLTGGTASITKDGNNASVTPIDLVNNNEPASGQTGDIVSLRYSLYGTTDSGSTFSRYEVAAIEACKDADMWTASGLADFDSLLKFYTIKDGARVNYLTITDTEVMIFKMTDMSYTFGQQASGIWLNNVGYIRSSGTASYNGAAIGDIMIHNDGVENWYAFDDGGLDGAGDLGIKAKKLTMTSGPLVRAATLVWRTIPIGRAVSNPTNFPSVNVLGTFILYGFDNVAEKVHFSFEVPDDWNGSSDLTLKAYWCAKDGDQIQDTEQVIPAAQYRCIDFNGGEAYDNGTAVTVSATYTQSGLGAAKQCHETSMTIDFDNVNQPITAGDDCGFIYYRNVTGESPSYSGEAMHERWEIGYYSIGIPSHM